MKTKSLLPQACQSPRLEDLNFCDMAIESLIVLVRLKGLTPDAKKSMTLLQKRRSQLIKSCKNIHP